MNKLRLALLISGGGTSAMAIHEATLNGPLRDLVEIACVISSNPKAGGLKKARDAEIPFVTLNPMDFPSPEIFGHAIIMHVKHFGGTAIGQHGWMAITPPGVMKSFPRKMLNQHPGPLDPGHLGFGGIKPGMYGARVSCARLLFCRTIKADYWTESTAQLVAENVDEGALVYTRKVPIEPDDTVESLQARLLPVEHETMIEAWRLMATGAALPYERKERLIQPKHLQVLADAKRTAQLLYPKG